MNRGQVNPTQKTIHIIRCNYANPSKEIQKRPEYSVMQQLIIQLKYNELFLDEVKSLGYDAKLYLVDMFDYKDVITKQIGPPELEEIIWNLCEGNDVDGFPGSAIPTFLEQQGYLFAGTRAEFSKIAVNKHLMKTEFQKAGVPTLPYIYISEWRDNIEQEIKDKELKYPFIVKFCHSYGSIGLSKDSVTHNFEEFKAHTKKMLTEYGPVIVEEFIIGREFEVFVFKDENDEIQTCPSVEMIFKKTVDPSDRWIDFDKKFLGWDDNIGMVEVSDSMLDQKLRDLSVAAFKSCNGNGYVRADLRTREDTGEIFVLEINDTCDLSRTSAADKMLKLAGRSAAGLISIVLKSAKRTQISVEKYDYINLSKL